MMGNRRTKPVLDLEPSSSSWFRVQVSHAELILQKAKFGEGRHGVINLQSPRTIIVEWTLNLFLRAIGELLPSWVQGARVLCPIGREPYQFQALTLSGISRETVVVL